MYGPYDRLLATCVEPFTCLGIGAQVQYAVFVELAISPSDDIVKGGKLDGL